jgi:hypothetical protein
LRIRTAYNDALAARDAAQESIDDFIAIQMEGADEEAEFDYENLTADA